MAEVVKNIVDKEGLRVLIAKIKASEAEGRKAANISVADASGVFTGATVEDVLKEVYDAAVSTASSDVTITTPTLSETEKENIAKRYVFTQNGNEIGTIDIPLDLVVSKGEVKTNPDAEHTGTFIILTLTNGDVLYIDVKGLVDIYTAVDTDEIDMTVSDYKISAVLKDGSIAKARLDAGVQASLGKADTAIQKDAMDSAISTAIGALDSSVAAATAKGEGSTVAADGATVGVLSGATITDGKLTGGDSILLVPVTEDEINELWGE